MSRQRFAKIVATVLRMGVTVSVVLIVLGFGASLLVGWSGSLNGAPSIPTDPADFSALVARLADLQPLAITQLGLLVLIATPVVRVAVSVGGFVIERDRLYAAITLAVLLILLASLFLIR